MWIWLLVLGERWELDFRWVQARDGCRRHFGSVYQISRVWKKLVRPVFFPRPPPHGCFPGKARRSGDWLDPYCVDQSVFYIYLFCNEIFDTPPVTPFDLVKTRLQTQLPRPRPLFPRPPNNTCCQPLNAASCVRNMSSLAMRSLPTEVVCVWEGGMFKTERVNGFFDALRHVWRAEGARGLWKGVGTTL